MADDALPEPATAASVARRAGVSITTVSFALNGQSERYGIAKETVQRVMEAARELNYVPNNLARSLRRKSTRAIGIVFPHLRNNWAHDLLEGMYPLFDREGFIPHIVSHRDSREREEHELRSLVELRMDGILCNPLSDSVDAYRQVLDRGVPLVFFGDTLEELPQVSYAAWDPAEVSISVQHLIDVGCRRIAYLGFVDQRCMSRARYKAFEMTLRQANVDLNPEWILLNRDGERFADSLRRIFAQRVRPDGIFALYNDSALDAMDTLVDLGVRIPEEVCIATLADSVLLGPRGYNLTTTTAPVQQEGLEAARALVRQIKRRDVSPVRKLVRGGRLICRRSTERPA